MFLGGFNISHFHENPAVSARMVYSPHPHPPFVALPLHAASARGKSYQSKGHRVVETKRAHRETGRMGMAEIPTRGYVYAS
jgi:hypothetical protein